MKSTKRRSVPDNQSGAEAAINVSWTLAIGVFFILSRSARLARRRRLQCRPMLRECFDGAGWTA